MDGALRAVAARDRERLTGSVGMASTEVDTLLDLNNPRIFMVEFDPTVTLGNIVTTKLHPAGKRSFTYDNAASPTVAQLKARFEAWREEMDASEPRGPFRDY